MVKEIDYIKISRTKGTTMGGINREEILMKKIASWLVTSTILVAAAAPAAADPLKAEVMHWWTSGGESAAVKVFADSFDKAGGQWIDSAVAGGEAARAAEMSRVVGGNPPAAMQFNYGKQFAELVNNGYLRDLTAIAKEENWAKIMPPAVIKAITFDGKVYAVPVNVHANNWAWISTDAFKKAGTEWPKSWDDFFPTLDKLKAAGVTPLALGAQAWQERILFEFILNSEGGADTYRKVFVDHDVDTIKGPKFKAAVATMGKLRAYVDDGSAGRNWNDTTALVISGKAGFQVMGDWSKGEFRAAGKKHGTDYTCQTGVGDAGGYIYAGDVFVLPKNDGAEVAKAQDLLVKTMLSPDVQVAFNAIKGSIPVRNDVDTSKVDPCGQIGLALLKQPEKQLPAPTFTITPDTDGVLNDALAAFWADKNADEGAFIQQFADAIAADGQ